MSQADRNPISVIALRADDFSPDGRHVIISLATKFSATERVYSVPVECLRDLVLDLRRLNAAASVIPIGPPGQPADASPSAHDPAVAGDTGVS
jgi:hypothetical protein